MFEDSLIESGGRLKTKRGWTSIVSFAIQIMIVGVMVLIPLIFTEALPKGQMMFLLVAPPPPPPPPPPAAAVVQHVKQIQTDIVNGELRTPTKIPQKVKMIQEDEAPPPTMAATGVVGGVPGGVPGGSMGGVIGSVFSTHAGRCAEDRYPAARARFGRRFAGSFDPQGSSDLSASGSSGPYSGRGRVCRRRSARTATSRTCS